MFSLSLQAQYFQRINAPMAVGDGVELANPWAGGLNAPQWSKADLDNDGKEDLYAFDRNGDSHLTFLNIGAAGEAKYRYAPELAANFPPSRFFVLLRDFNHEGVPGFICGQQTGFYQNPLSRLDL